MSTSAITGRIHAVLLDLDGVLVSTDELHFQAWQAMADADGLRFDRTVNDRLRGVGRAESLMEILRAAGQTRSPARFAALMDAKNQHYQRLVETLTSADLHRGAAETLELLASRSIPAAVVSVSRNARRIIERVGIRPQLATIVDGGDAQRSKPDPQGFLIAAERLGVRSTSCLVIEDAASGVEAARRGGMHCLALGPPARFAGLRPDLISDGFDTPTLNWIKAALRP